jgi:glycosyltransferase involved in cell wall biosynthesis
MSFSPNHVAPYDLVCFSHLRWNFVFQRPQHLLSRCAKRRRVFYVEEPMVEEGTARLEVNVDAATGVHVVTPHVPSGTTDAEQARLLVELCDDYAIRRYVCWFYTPMALPVAAQLEPLARVYDCMDELSAFKGAPPQLLSREAELMDLADVVFTGGHALFEAKKSRHRNIHPFPSSVDCTHFGQARLPCREPTDQASILRPRLGFFGVIDERMDLKLLDAVARARPDWQLILLGPVVKIDPSELPRLPNLHYLGAKSYAELPSYISGWDVALLPFAKNDATRFISPTKTPEYLAAGKPVVSTSIRDVVRPYAGLALARIADTPRDFVAACEAAMLEPNERLLRRADPYLARLSWDKTWQDMEALMGAATLPSLGQAGGEQDLTSGEHELAAFAAPEAREVG